MAASLAVSVGVGNPLRQRGMADHIGSCPAAIERIAIIVLPVL